GEISMYESNVSFADYPFNFSNPAVAMMLNGTKTITWKNQKFQFKPGELFILQTHQELQVAISDASMENPVKCAIIKIDHSFISDLFEEAVESQHREWAELLERDHSKLLDYFISSENLLLNSFSNLLHDRYFL